MNRSIQAQQRRDSSQPAAATAKKVDKAPFLVVVRDTQPALSKYGVPIESADRKLKREIKALEKRLITDLARLIPIDAQLKSFTRKSWAKSILRTTKRMFPNNFVVSLDPLLAKGSQFTLNLTKIGDDITNRPGTPAKREQIESLANEFRKSGLERITLKEISGLTGATLSRVISELKASQLPIDSVVLGAVSENANELLSREHKDVQFVALHPAARGLEMSKLLMIGGRRSLLNSQWAALSPDIHDLFIQLCLRYNGRLAELLEQHDIDTAKIKTASDVRRS